ncbi:ribonuclease H-like domain-containing protein [Tanacetum coccineum]
MNQDRHSSTQISLLALKIPIIKKGEYDIWSMRMGQYICHTDHNLWDIIINGDLQEESAQTGDQSGPSAPPVPKTAKQLATKRNQERMLNLSRMAIKSRLGGMKNQKDAEDIDDDDLEELDLRWQVAMLTIRVKKFIQKTGKNLDFKEKRHVSLDSQIVSCYLSQIRALCSGNADLKGLREQDLLCQMSARDKTGLGYGTHLNEMSNNSETDSEIILSVFNVRSSDEESTPVNDRFSKADGYHVVPPPITGNFLTPRPDISFEVVGLREMKQGFLNRSNKTSLKRDGKKGSMLRDLAKKVKNVDGKILGKDGKPLLPYRCIKDKASPSVLVDKAAVIKVNTKDVCEAGSSKPALVDTENNYVVARVTSVLSKIPTIDVGSEVMGINTPAHEDVVDLTLADVIIPQDQVDTLKGMESVLEQRPWRIRSVPLILNMWNPNSDLKKEDIKKVHVWVKLFNVPVVAYLKVGLMLITAKLACKIFDHVDKECHKKEKVEMGKSSMDADLVHGKRNSKIESVDIKKTTRDNSSLASREGVNVACDKPRDSSNVIKEDSSRPTNTTSIIQDEIDLDQLRNNMNKLVEEEKVAKEAATMASSNKPKLSFGDLNLTNISDSDEEDVFASIEEFEAYLSSVGGGNQLEEEFDLYDDDYADQIRDLPGQIKEFRDFQLLNSGRK